MIDHRMISFLGGMTAMAYVVAGLFFLRFWRRSRDQLFLAFAFAFWLMGANQAVMSLVTGASANRGEAYILRLFAFLLIAIAIMRKNAQSKTLN